MQLWIQAAILIRLFVTGLRTAPIKYVRKYWSICLYVSKLSLDPTMNHIPASLFILKLPFASTFLEYTAAVNMFSKTLSQR